jgi:hypothetical protein
MNKNRGSAVIVLILVIVILALVAGGIWYYEAHSGNVLQSPSGTSVASSSTFSIPEWGVEFQIPTALNGLVYNISNKQDQAAVATFSTNDLESVAPSCLPNIGQGIGVLSRWLYSASDTTAGVHIGAYTYAFIEASGNCAEPAYLPGGNFTVTTSTQIFSTESSQLETAINNTLTSTTVYGVMQPTAELTASEIIQGLQNTFTQQGYTVGADATGSDIFWWLDSSGIAINLPEVNVLSFNFKTSTQTSYGAQNITNLPEAAQLITTTNSYFAAQGFAVQSNQSTGMNNNVNTDQDFTNAYFNPESSVRCRSFIYTLTEAYPGEQNVSYSYTETIACADNTDYTAAYNAQAPYLENSHDGQDSGMLSVIDPSYNYTCNSDPSLKLISLDAVNGTESGRIVALKLVNGAWIDTGLSPYQITMQCFR